MEKETILFLCTGNSARSQMAEALLRFRAADRYDVHSAGTHPAGVHPLTRVVLAELGLNTSAQRSKGLDEYLGKKRVHIVITVCARAEKACPVVWPGVGKRLAWHFEDPTGFEGTEEERLARFRTVRDQIDVRIQEWLRKKPEA